MRLPAAVLQRWLAVLTAALLLAACGGERSSEDVGAAEDSAATPDGSPMSFALAPEISAACDSAAARWVQIPGAAVVRGDTLFSTADLLPEPAGDGVFAIPPLQAYQGCHVFGEAVNGLDAAAQERLFWRSGTWPLLPRMAAEGPEGRVRTFQRGRVRCQIGEEWDGVGDADTTYVPEPFFRERTLCWQHTRELVPSDTARAPG